MANKEGFDSEKRFGNSAMRGHGVNSPAMMEARKGHKEKEEHEKGESKLKEKKEHLAKKMHGKMKEKWSSERKEAGSMSYLGKK